MVRGHGSRSTRTYQAPGCNPGWPGGLAAVRFSERRGYPAGVTGRRLDPLLEEALVATGAVTLLGVVLALLFWAVTGMSPWPYVVLGEVAGLGFGIALLALSSPRRSR